MSITISYKYEAEYACNFNKNEETNKKNSSQHIGMLEGENK